MFSIECHINKADQLTRGVIELIKYCGYKDENPRPKYKDGTPAHTYSINHVVHQYDISNDEFPITSLRPIAVKSAIGEVMWIYQDQSNSLDLLANKYNIRWWDSWDIGDGTIGCCYGETVRRHDLMNKLLEDIKNDPYGRRHIINMWQEDDFEHPHGLKPCCYQTVWNVRGEYLDMCLFQRSSDFLTAGNINQIQYVALMMMVAKHCGYKPGKFTHFIANCQIYDRHMDNAEEMDRRYRDIMLKNSIVTKPILKLDTDKTNFYDFTVDDFKLENYTPIKPQLKFELGI